MTICKECGNNRTGKEVEEVVFQNEEMEKRGVKVPALLVKHVFEYCSECNKYEWINDFNIVILNKWHRNPVNKHVTFKKLE